jgi:hypothetical protein
MWPIPKVPKERGRLVRVKRCKHRDCRPPKKRPQLPLVWNGATAGRQLRKGSGKSAT